ncbi:MAG: RhuM family protein, partial [Thermovirgaceae bacterium]
MAKKKNDSKSSNGNSSAIAKNLGAVTNDLTVLPPEGQLLIYQDGALRVQVRMDGQTVWLTQAAIAELYQTTSQNITMHLKGIYLDGELNEGSTCKEFLQVRREGARDVQRKIKHYNLEAILAVGYRVRSGRGTAFRQWATARLSELLVKGFTMDDE